MGLFLNVNNSSKVLICGTWNVCLQALFLSLTWRCICYCSALLYKTKDAGGVERHGLKLEAADHAAVFQELRVRTFWLCNAHHHHINCAYYPWRQGLHLRGCLWCPIFYVLLMFSIISLGGGGIKMFYVFLESVIKHKIQHLHLYCNDLWVIRSMKS